MIERAAPAIEEGMNELAKVIDDGDGGPFALEPGGEAPGGHVVARAVAGGEDQDAGHRPASSYLVSHAGAG